MNPEMNEPQKTDARTLRERRPKGEFNPECLLPISSDVYMQMDKAKKEDMIKWQKSVLNNLEDSFFSRNLAYIKSRLEVWGDHATLLDLERDKFGWSPATSDCE